MDQTCCVICDGNLIDDKMFAIDINEMGVEDVLKECWVGSPKVRAPARFRQADGACMHTLALPRISAFVLMASCLLFAQPQSTIPAAPAQANPSAQPPTNESMQQPATQPQANEPRQHLPTLPKLHRLRKRRRGGSSTPHALEAIRAVAPRRFEFWV